MEQLNSEDTIDEDEEELPEMKETKRPIITFAKLNKYFFIVILCPIFCMLTNFFGLLIDEIEIIKRDELLESILSDFSYIFAGMFYFISYFRVNYNKNNDSSSNIENNNSGIVYIYNESIIYNYNPYKIIILIILLSLINGIQDILIIFINDNNFFEERLYYFFFIPLFSKLILKQNIFKHQYFSLLLAIIGNVFLFIPVCLVFKKEDIIPNILNFITGIIYPLFLVIIKFISEKYYISPLKIGLLIGIITIFIHFILYTIYSLIVYKDLTFFKDSFDFNPIENKFKISVYIILLILFNTTLNLLTLLALFYFSPTLIMITDIISPFLLWIAKTIKDGGKINELILNSIGYVIVIFSAFIYNEIIILNFCGLNKNTKTFVNQRLKKELDEIKKNKETLLLIFVVIKS